jgi:hypothetical protein
MLYDGEDEGVFQKRKKNLTMLYNVYRKTGGFGYYSVDDLIGLHIQMNDIEEMISQETKIIELYNVTYNKTITRLILERDYLGRSCVNAYQRYKQTLSKYYIPQKYVCMRGGKVKDPFENFVRHNTVKGYFDRLFWKEKENERFRFTQN